MKTKKSSTSRLNNSCLPDRVYVCFEQFKTETITTDIEVVQNQSGRLLIKKMAKHFLNEKQIKIYTKKNEKPEVFCGEIEISVSFSHTDDGVSGSISKEFNVGCDMEHVDRDVHPQLVDRMKHDRESGSLYENTDPIRIWTLKESALKMIGTGLRKPMKSVQISSIEENQFGVQFDDGKGAKICSFQYKHHWISICYQALSHI